MIAGVLFLVGFALALYCFYKWATRNYDYFERNGIAALKPKFLIGNTGGLYANRYTPQEFSDYLYTAFPKEK